MVVVAMVGGGGQVLRARTHECKVNATLLFNFTDG